MATSEPTTSKSWIASSPKRAASTLQQQALPDSPDYVDKYSSNSDDYQLTSNLHSSTFSHSSHSQNLVIVGSHEKTITLGRGGACTVKIGRRNRQISRVHVSIAFNAQKEMFELTVLGLNGACVDDIQYDQHGVAPLEDNSFVDVLGDQFHFRMPPPPSINFADKLQQQQHMEEVVIQKKKDLFKEMSPEPEQQQQQQPALKMNDEIDTKNEQENLEEPSSVINKPQDNIMKEQEQKVNEDENDFPIELIPDEALSPIEKELSPEQEDINIVEDTTHEEEKMEETNKDNTSNILQEKNEQNKDDAHDYAEVIIDALVFSRTSSMPISDICSRILKANPAYAEQPREIWIERIRTVLKEKPFFGEIQRKGKTADGSPTENLYYYNSELDPVEWRRATYTQVGRSARKCTLKDKQYFWKIPPKLGRHRSSYIPPSASDLKRQRAAAKEDENTDPKKTKY